MSFLKVLLGFYILKVKDYAKQKEQAGTGRGTQMRE